MTSEIERGGHLRTPAYLAQFVVFSAILFTRFFFSGRHSKPD